jgi:prevent-host-death family protein
MKSVSLKDLKQNLSQYAEEAAQGASIQVTKYNRPFVLLVGARSPSLHIGLRAGTGFLQTVGKKATEGKFLKTLLEDREGDDDV